MSNAAVVSAVMLQTQPNPPPTNAIADMGSHMFEHLTNPCLLQDHSIAVLSLIGAIACIISIHSDRIDDAIWGKIFAGIVATGLFGIFSKSVFHCMSHTYTPEFTITLGICMYAVRELVLAYFVRPFKRWYYQHHPHWDRRKSNCRRKKVKHGN